ncbi:MAG: hypothetical protein N2050_07325 [Flavobacteriales bacterium]|nr:hypothetical protein [Flavobacteriales bacterium]
MRAKNYFFVGVFIFMMNPIYVHKMGAQVPAWAWTASGGDLGLGLSYASSVAVDGQGNAYVGGLHGNVIAVQKYTASGVLQWTSKTTLHNAPLNTLEDIDVDASGNIYITGTYYDSCMFGGTQLVVNTDPNMEFAAYVAKLDSDGNFLWAVSGSTTSCGTALCALPGGGVAVTGFFPPSAQISMGGVSASSVVQGGRNFFLARLDADGQGQWIRVMGAEIVVNNFMPRIHDLKSDAAGNIYGVGYLSFGANQSTTLDFGGVQLTGQGMRVVVFKCNPGGQMGWVKTSVPSDNNKYASGQGIGLDGAGNVYVAGWSETALAFDNFSTSNSSLQPFAVKLDNNGIPQWLKNFGICFDNNPYTHSIGLDVAADGDGYVSGWFIPLQTDPIDFGNGVTVSGFTPGGMERNYVVKMDQNGITQWVKANLQPTGDVLMNIDLDPAENAYVCGRWILGSGYDNLPPLSGPVGIFVAKLGNASIGFPDMDSEMPLRIFPNPTSHYLTIDGISSGWMEVLDGKGCQLFSQKIQSAPWYFNCASLKDGFYFLRIRTESTTCIRPFAVQRY